MAADANVAAVLLHAMLPDIRHTLEGKEEHTNNVRVAHERATANPKHDIAFLARELHCSPEMALAAKLGQFFTH